MSVRATVSTTPPVPGPAPRTVIPDALRWRTGNGIRVVAVPAPELPLVSLRLVLPAAGAAADPPGAPGTAALVSSLIGEGTREMEPDALNQAIDALGISLEVHASHDVTDISLSALPEVLADALPLLAEIVTRPSFPDAEVDRIRGEHLDALAARADDPGTVADDVAAEAVYGARNPYGRPVDGTPDGLAAATRDVLEGFHSERYRPGGAILVMSGPVDKAAVEPLLERSFSRWSGTAPEVPPAGGPRARPRDVRRAWPGDQAELRLATVGLPRASDRWITAAVTNYLLGGSTITGRLGANLREEKGWTYGVGSAFQPARSAGIWVAATAVAAEVAEEAIGEMIAEIERLRSELVAADELRTAKDALVLSLARAFETVDARTARFATVETFDLEGDYWARLAERVRAVTAEDVRDAARDLLNPARMARVVVGGG